MNNKKSITIREMIDEFVREAFDPDEESTRDINNQKLGFLCGLASAMDYLTNAECEIDATDMTEVFFEIVGDCTITTIPNREPSTN